MKPFFDFVGNTIIAIMSTLFGTFIGAILLYFVIGGIYMSFFYTPVSDGPMNPHAASEECARGSAIAWLSILLGGVIGGILGLIASVKNIQKGSKCLEQNLKVSDSSDFPANL